MGLASRWRWQGPVHNQFVLYGNGEADTEVRLQGFSPAPGLRIPFPDAGGQAAVDGGPAGVLCKLSRAQVRELEAGRAE